MVTNEEVKKIAKLSRLHFEEDKLTGFAAQLTEIMNMIHILNEIDCSNVIPLTSVCDTNQRLRADEVTCADISDELFSNLPNNKSAVALAKEVKYFIVPKVME